MALKIEWGDDTKTCIYTKFTANWSWQEFRANRPQYEEMLNSVSHPVDFIADFSDAHIIPTNMLANVKNIFDTRLENEGQTLVVGAGQTILLTYKMVAAILPVVKDYVIFVSTLEEAIDVVQKQHDSRSTKP